MENKCENCGAEDNTGEGCLVCENNRLKAKIIGLEEQIEEMAYEAGFLERDNEH